MTYYHYFRWERFLNETEDRNNWKCDFLNMSMLFWSEVLTWNSFFECTIVTYFTHYANLCCLSYKLITYYISFMHGIFQHDGLQVTNYLFIHIDYGKIQKTWQHSLRKKICIWQIACLPLDCSLTKIVHKCSQHRSSQTFGVGFYFPWTIKRWKYFEYKVSSRFKLNS